MRKFTVLCGLIVLVATLVVSAESPEAADPVAKEPAMPKSAKEKPSVAIESRSVFADAVPPEGVSLALASIAVCDPHKAFDNYKNAQDAVVALKATVEQVRVQITAKAQAVVAKQKELDDIKKQKSEEYKLALQELINLKAEFQAFQATTSARVADRRRELAVNVYADIYAATATVAKERGISLVLTKDQPGLATRNITELLAKLYYRRQVLYADDSLDITDEVIEVLNEKS